MEVANKVSLRSIRGREETDHVLANMNGEQQMSSLLGPEELYRRKIIKFAR
jgi:hypothetical protein